MTSFIDEPFVKSSKVRQMPHNNCKYFGFSFHKLALFCYTSGWSKLYLPSSRSKHSCFVSFAIIFNFLQIVFKVQKKHRYLQFDAKTVFQKTWIKKNDEISKGRGCDIVETTCEDVQWNWLTITTISYSWFLIPNVYFKPGMSNWQPAGLMRPHYLLNAARSIS